MNWHQWLMRLLVPSTSPCSWPSLETELKVCLEEVPLLFLLEWSITRVKDLLFDSICLSRHLFYFSFHVSDTWFSCLLYLLPPPLWQQERMTNRSFSTPSLNMMMETEPVTKKCKRDWLQDQTCLPSFCHFLWHWHSYHFFSSLRRLDMFGWLNVSRFKSSEQIEAFVNHLGRKVLRQGSKFIPFMLLHPTVLSLLLSTSRITSLGDK